VRIVTIAVAALLLAFVPAAFAHPERTAHFPDGSTGAVPKFRATAGQILTVCKRDSAKRIRATFKGSSKLRRQRRTRLRQLRKCRFRHIQAAVDKAFNGALIRVMPGVYKEEPSRRNPEPDPRCADDYDTIGGPLESGPTGEGAKVANYEYQRKCPNAQNLIAIIGDTNGDRLCDSKCNIQLQGMGRRRTDVLISGQRTKLNVVRADRADGIYLKNFTVEFSDFNNVYILETNGFRMEDSSRATRASTASSPSPPTTGSTTAWRPTAPAIPGSTPARVPRATASATASRSATSTPTTTRSATRARPATACGRTTTTSTTTRRA